MGLFTQEVTHFNVLGIDPGSAHLGVAVYTLDLKTKEIVSVNAFTIDALKSKYFNKQEVKLFGEKIVRIRSMVSEMQEVLHEYRPGLVVFESPFFNRFTPSAYGALKELLIALKLSLLDYNQSIPMADVDPPSAKKAIGAKGNAKKEDMTDALKLHVKKQGIPLLVEIDDLDEHSIDACAIGYWALMNIIAKKNRF